MARYKRSRRLAKLSGAMTVLHRAKGRCFRDFRGHVPLIEICLEAIKDSTDLVLKGKVPFFSDAAKEVLKGCVNRPLNHQVACITGATEVLLKSRNVPGSLAGRKRRRR